MHCVDLGESFPTRIYLQKSASIQPRTSPSKFGGENSIQYSLHSLVPPVVAPVVPALAITRARPHRSTTSASLTPLPSPSTSKPLPPLNPVKFARCPFTDLKQKRSAWTSSAGPRPGGDSAHGRGGRGRAPCRPEVCHHVSTLVTSLAKLPHFHTILTSLIHIYHG